MFISHSFGLEQLSRKLIVWPLAFTLCVFSSGCGVGAGSVIASGGVGSGGTGAAEGTIIGFGSVIVDGQEIDDASASLEVESKPGSPNRAGIDTTETRLGQQAFISTDTAFTVATDIKIRPPVIGVVESVDLVAGKIVVAGQNVIINSTPTHGAPTVFGGYEQLSDILPGDQVLVHGHLHYVNAGATYQIQATRIELQRPGVVQVRVTGTVTNLNSIAMQFNLGALLVKYDSSVTMLPAGATLANGKSLVVWSTNLVSSGQLQAQIISTVADPMAGLPVRIGGLISGCGTTACTGVINVDSFTVDPSSASITGGTSTQFIDGQYVAIVGTADSQTGIIKATSITLRSNNASDFTAYGTIFDPVGTTTFLLHGVPIVATLNTVNNSSCSYTEGQPVRITGLITGNRVTAQNINCLSSLEGLTVVLRGAVSNLDLSANSFQLSNAVALDTVKVNFATATFLDGTSSSLSDGGYVVVSGKVTNGTLAAKRVRITSAPVSSQLETEGIAYAVIGSISFKINGVAINYNSNAVVGGTLENGRRVRVQFISGPNSTYQATKVTIL